MKTEVARLKQELLGTERNLTLEKQKTDSLDGGDYATYPNNQMTTGSQSRLGINALVEVLCPSSRYWIAKYIFCFV